MIEADLLLLFSPQLLPVMPPAGIGYLVAALRRDGLEPRVEDLNAQLYDFLLSARCFASLAALAEQAGRQGHGDAAEHAQIAAELHRMARAVEPAKAQLKRPATYADPPSLGRALHTVERALALASTIEQPGYFALAGAALAADASPAAIAEQVRGCASGVVEFLRYHVARCLDRCPARLVAISNVASTELAFVVAALVKAHDPRRFVVLGGPGPTSLRALICDDPGYFDFVDAIVVYDGDRALPALTRALASAGDRREPPDLSAVPNLIYRRAAAGDDARDGLVHTPLLPVPLAAAPPDYGDLDLSLYLSPGPALPLQIGRACYWHKCEFCNRADLIGEPGHLRAKSATQVADEIADLAQAHGARHFYITDDAVPAATLSRLAAELSRRALDDLRWMALARFEPRLADAELMRALRRGGCAKLCLALESAAPRVLHAMNKGIRVETAERVINAAAAAEMPLHIWTMTGFPGETFAEAQQTQSFVERLLPLLDRPGFSFQVSAFALHARSPIAAQPERHGVSQQRDPDRRLVPFCSAFVAEGREGWPMTPEAAADRFAAEIAAHVSTPELVTSDDVVGAILGMYCACDGATP